MLVALRECQGLAVLSFPAWLRKAQSFDALMSAVDGDPAGREFRVLVNGAERWGFITPSSLIEGPAWRLTWFDKNGFCGHGFRSTKDEALAEIADYEQVVVDLGALDRLASTRSFQLGLAKVDLLRQLNAGDLDWAGFLQASAALT